MTKPLIHPSHRPELRPTLGIVLLMLLLVFNALLLPAPDVSRGLANYLPLHITLEVVAIAIAAMVFAVGWSTQKYNRNGNVVWLACMFLGVALSVSVPVRPGAAHLHHRRGVDRVQGRL